MQFTLSFSEPSIMTLIPIFPLSHLFSARCPSFHLSNRSLANVPSSLRPVSKMTLSGMAAKSAKRCLDGPCEREAGTARISFGSFEEYFSIKAWGLGKNSRCLRRLSSLMRLLSRDTHLKRSASAPSASSSSSSRFLFRSCRPPSSPTSSLLIVPPNHSIILLTNVSISAADLERMQMG
jgi:hypothetical protein